MITEKEYIKKTDITHRKKFAQFFTPVPVSDFMAKWVMEGKSECVDVLEPAFGLGVFSRSIYKIHSNVRITGYDIDKTIFKYALSNFSNGGIDITLQNKNYLTTPWDEKYDAVICNPPYLKFHDYDNSSLIPIVNKKLHIQLNGFTNIYTLFLLKSIYQMKEGGKLAYIVPSEFLNSDYGVEVKRTLLKSRTLRHIIIVDFTQCAFDDALTTACILLCEKTSSSSGIRISTLDSIDKLDSSLYNYITIDSNQLKPEVKWKQYYENTQSSKYKNLVPFSIFAKVSRGIATGANNYFTFKASKKDIFNIPDNCFRPCICHAIDVQNQIFTESDFEKLVNMDKTVFLFNGCADESDPHVKGYIRLGIECGINKKHLTSNRSPWYALENRKPSPIWVSVFSREGIRFVRNKAGVYNLTTFHCVYSKEIIDIDILFAYLVTNVAKEIFLDNSRQYGNGLIKFEPNDLNKGNILDLRLLTNEEIVFLTLASSKLNYYGSINSQCIHLIDDFFRAKYTHGRVNLNHFFNSLKDIDVESATNKSPKNKSVHIKQLNFLDLFEHYSNSPIVNNMVHEDIIETYEKTHPEKKSIDESKNALISLISKESEMLFLNNSASIYYTGKKFPSTILLSKLYYFIPYIKRKGIRDLYLIKVVRVGSRKEGQTDNDPKDYRLVFEIEYLCKLFDDYQNFTLNIWRTFTNTTISELLSKMKNEV